jgi:hypothetical protein
VLLSASRHQIDILEDKEDRRRQPLFAFLNLGKSIDQSIQHVLGVSPKALAHIIPAEKVSIDEQTVSTMGDTELLRLSASYDARFATAERHVYLRGPRESLGIGYRYVRGACLGLAVKLLRAYRGRH